MLYPLKFEPILKEMIWGGTYLYDVLGKGENAIAKVGESWEISTLEDNISVVANGFLKGNTLEELIEVYMGDLLGESVYEKFGIELPVLIKVIDAHADLSVQVHPNEAQAKKQFGAHGKNEMWYILEAQKEANVIAGFDQTCSRAELEKSIAETTVDSLLRKDTVYKGDILYIPSGRIHAIGSGCVIIEIQQTSNVTFRVYDYDRKDAQGQKRELHVKEAFDVIDYKASANYKTTYTKSINQPENVVKCDYFTTNIFSFDKKVGRDYYFLDSYVILICTEGEFLIEYEGEYPLTMKLGESVLLPAQIREFFFTPLTGKSTFLETYYEV